MNTDAMRTVSAFHGLTDDELHRVMCCCEEIELKGDTVIFREKDPASHLYTLRHGKVAIRYRLPYRSLGSEHPITTITSGGTFGWSSLDPDACYRFSAYCVEDNSRALRCERRRLLDILDRNHTIGYKIMRNLAVVAGTRFVALQNEIARRQGHDFMNGW